MGKQCFLTMLNNCSFYNLHYVNKKKKQRDIHFKNTALIMIFLIVRRIIPIQIVHFVHLFANKVSP